MKVVFVWIWIVFSALAALAGLVGTIIVLVRGGLNVGLVIPAVIAVTFGWSSYESWRRRRFKFFFFET